MNDMKIQELIYKAKNNLEDYQKYVEKHGIVPCAWDVSSRLEEAIQMICDLRDEIFSINAETQAIRAVKDRFKELYVEAVVDKALKEEITEVQENNNSDEKTVFFRFHGTADNNVYSFRNLKEMLLALEKQTIDSELNKEKYTIKDIYVSYEGYNIKISRDAFIVWLRRKYEKPEIIGYCTFIDI